jgi:aerobic carbon-monoxide dehydrogenase large subunit
MQTTILTDREGESQPRVEDPRLLTGKGRFVDDLNAEDQAYMGLVLSPLAHARIKSIDLSKLSSSPEFIAALTGEDLVKEGVLPVAQNPWPPQKRANRYHLSVGKVRFVGEPVVAILARNKRSVEDLIEQVEVEYEELPVVTTIEQSKKGDNLIYDDWKDNVSQTNEMKYGVADKMISSAAFIVNVKEGIKRQESAPIEAHAVLVSYDKSRDVYHVYSTVQSVHGIQNVLATELNLPRQKFHARVMDVGGGFGSKGGPSYPWPLLACLFAKKTGLPVKWSATRTEEFLEAAAGRDEYCDLTLACNKDGKIMALKARVECDVGVSGTQTHMPSMTMWMMSGPYRILSVDLEVTAYVTNKMPIGPVRGAGAPEGCYFIERAVEIMAKKIGLDPLEFRRRNIGESRKPGAEDYHNLFDILTKSSDYSRLLQWRNDLNSKFKRSSSSVLGGIGISARGSSEEEEEEGAEEGEGFSGQGDRSSWNSNSQSSEGEKESSSGSSSWQGNRGDSSREESSSNDSGGNSWFMTESGRVVLHKDGTVTVFTGSSPHGQGHETTFAQLASEELGIPIGKVKVVWGDTSLIPFGIGTFGSRSAVTGGSAVVDATRRVKSEFLEKASKMVGKDAKSLDIRNGVLVDNTGKSISSIEQILEKLGGSEISANSKFTPSTVSHSNAVQLCALTLDVETGKTKISKYFVVEDAGKMINKSIVEGQVQGGVIHGVGGALLEELAYDEQGNLLTSTFMDYSIPTATDSPDIEIFHKTTPSTFSLDGAKGVGESGTIAAYAAVMNALNDALSQFRKGAEVNICPALPDSVYASIARGD